MKKKLKIEKSKYPTEEVTHVLWLETNTPRGINYRGIFHGTYQQCLEEKERLERGNKDVSRAMARHKGLRWLLSNIQFR